MAHDTTVCITVECDHCKVRAANSAGYPAHWATLAEALADLSGPAWGWSASSSSQTCAHCVQLMACRAAGHDWGEWQDMRWLGEAELAIRICQRCGRDEVVALECLQAGCRPALGASGE